MAHRERPIDASPLEVLRTDSGRLELLRLLGTGLVEELVKLLFLALELLVSFLLEPFGRALNGEHPRKLASSELEIVPVTLLNNFTLLENVDEVAGADLGQVVGDNDGCLVGAGPLDRLKDEDAGRRIESRGGFICK